MDIVNSLIAQYLAALEMLRQAIIVCPAAVWDDPNDRNRFWHVAYHALFFTYEYVGEPGEAVTPWDGHRAGYEDFDPTPAEPYDKDTLLAYLDICRQRVIERVPVLNMGWGADDEYTGFELQIYSIRHLMQHVGELLERLAARGGAEVDWVGTVRDWGAS